MDIHHTFETLLASTRSFGRGLTEPALVLVCALLDERTAATLAGAISPGHFERARQTASEIFG